MDFLCGQLRRLLRRLLRLRRLRRLGPRLGLLLSLLLLPSRPRRFQPCHCGTILYGFRALIEILHALLASSLASIRRSRLATFA